MAKVQTIQEKREAMEKALKRLEAFEVIITKLEEDCSWKFSTWATDESGEWIFDSNGDHIMAYPTGEDDYRHDEYMAYLAAIDEIKALV